MGDRPEKSSFGARHRESILADVLRHWDRENRGGFRFAGRMAVESGVAGLSGDGVRAVGVGWEGLAKINRHERDLPAVAGGDARSAPARSGKSMARSRAEVPVTG